MLSALVSEHGIKEVDQREILWCAVIEGYKSVRVGEIGKQERGEINSGGNPLKCWERWKENKNNGNCCLRIEV